MKKGVKEKSKVVGVIKSLLIIGVLLLVVLIVLEIGLYVTKPAKEIPSKFEGTLGTIGVLSKGEITANGADISSLENYSELNIIKRNCSDINLKEIWDFVFKESSNDTIILAAKDSREVCNSSLMYKILNNNLTYLLYVEYYEDSLRGYLHGGGTYLYGNFSEDSLNMLRGANISNYDDSMDNFGEGVFSDLRGPRSLNNIDSIDIEYHNIFKLNNGSWYFSDPGYVFNIYDYSGETDKNVFAGIVSNYTYDVLTYNEKYIYPPNLTQIKDIEEVILNGKNYHSRVIDIEEYFANFSYGNFNKVILNYSLSNPGAFEVYKNNWRDYNYPEDTGPIYYHYLDFDLNSITPRETLMNISFSYPGMESVTSNNFKVTAYDCYDSDGGINDTEPRDAHNSTSSYKYDVCLDNSTLKEYYCSNDSVENISITCSSENYCNYDACRKKINLTQTRNIEDLTIYSSEYDLYIKDYFDNLGYYDYDLKFNYSVSNMSALYASMYFYNGVPTLDFNIGDLLMGDYIMNITLSYLVQNVTSNNFNVSIRACYDSDGWDYYEKGTTKNITINATDYCIDDTEGREFSCYMGNVLNESFSCYNRYYCNDGFCDRNSSYYCWDNDGGNNANIKGVTTNRSRYYPYEDLSNYSDSCYNSTAVFEYYCGGDDTYQDNSVNSSIIECASDYYCNDGVCVQNSTDDGDDGDDGGGGNNNNNNNQNNRTNITITLFKINNPFPPEANVSMSVNRTTLFMISNTIYDSIRWYLDGVVVKNSTNFFEAGNLTAGNHTIRVEIRKGSLADSRVWLLTVKAEENPNKGWDTTLILFWIIVGVALIIGILFAVLIIIQNTGRGKAGVISSKDSPVLDLNPVKKQGTK